MTTLHCTEIKIKNKERNDNSLVRPYQGEQTPCEMFVLQSLQYLLLNERLLHTSGSYLLATSAIRVRCLPILFYYLFIYFFAINLHRNKKTKRKEKKMYYVFSHVKDYGLRKKIYLCPYFSHIHSLTSKNTSKPNTVALRILLSLKNTISLVFFFSSEAKQAKYLLKVYLDPYNWDPVQELVWFQPACLL